MHAAAARLGMRHTHFTSPDGLPYPTETSTYSTPPDLLTLGLAAMRYPAFRSIVDQPIYHLPKGHGHHGYWWYNDDDLIGSYQGAPEIKSGYTAPDTRHQGFPPHKRAQSAWHAFFPTGEGTIPGGACLAAG